MHKSMTDLVTEPNAPQPWPEARGPHLPDALSVIPGLAWIFIVFAAARVMLLFDSADLGPAPEPTRIAAYVLASIPSVVTVLLPVALLARHPDAAIRARTLLVGTILLALVEGMKVLRLPLQPVFEQLTPARELDSLLVPLAVAYDAAVGLLGTLGAACIGLGLAQARQRKKGAGAFSIAIALIAMIALIAVLASADHVILAARQFSFEQVQITLTVIVYVGSFVILPVLAVTAWAYLAIVAIGGTRAREKPMTAWILGASGASLIFLIRAQDAVWPLFMVEGLEMHIIYALGFLTLLGGVAAGLPSLDEGESNARADQAV